MNFLKKMKKADELLNLELGANGFFSEKILFDIGFNDFFVKILIFFLKRDSNFGFFYLCENGTRYNYKLDVPKNMKSTLCFYRKLI